MEQIGNNIYDQVCYDVRFNIETGEVSCTCEGFTYLRHCKHSDKHKKMAEQFLKDIEMMAS